MARYVIVLEDTPTGGVTFSSDGTSKLQAAAVAGGFAPRTASFDYLVACFNVCKDRSQGIGRDVEKKLRAGIITGA